MPRESKPPHVNISKQWLMYGANRSANRIGTTKEHKFVKGIHPGPSRAHAPPRRIIQPSAGGGHT